MEETRKMNRLGLRHVRPKRSYVSRLAPSAAVDRWIADSDPVK